MLEKNFVFEILREKAEDEVSANSIPYDLMFLTVQPSIIIFTLLKLVYGGRDVPYKIYLKNMNSVEKKQKNK